MADAFVKEFQSLDGANRRATLAKLKALHQKLSDDEVGNAGKSSSSNANADLPPAVLPGSDIVAFLKAEKDSVVYVRNDCVTAETFPAFQKRVNGWVSKYVDEAEWISPEYLTAIGKIEQDYVQVEF